MAMEYLFESEELNPVSLETKLGLRRGDIEQVKISSEGYVEVIVRDSIATETVRGKLETEFKSRGLVRGKKG